MTHYQRTWERITGLRDRVVQGCVFLSALKEAEAKEVERWNEERPDEPWIPGWWADLKEQVTDLCANATQVDILRLR